jgi:hypothetical protein
LHRFFRSLETKGIEGERAAFVLQTFGEAFRAYDQRGLTQEIRLIYLFKVEVLCRQLLGPDAYRVGGLKGRRTKEGLLIENLFTAVANANSVPLLYTHLTTEEVGAFCERSLSQNGNENEFNQVRQDVPGAATAKQVLGTQRVRDQVTLMKNDPHLLDGEATSRLHFRGSRFQLYEDKSAAAAPGDLGSAWNDGTGVETDSKSFKSYTERTHKRALSEIKHVRSVRDYHRVR